jgi:hypothetical protein
VLDAMFNRLLSRNGHLFPTWWKEAVTTPFQPNDLIN